MKARNSAQIPGWRCGQRIAIFPVRAHFGCLRCRNVNANDWLVRRGFAWSYRKMKAYRAAEAEARAAGRGIWRGENLQPWERRKQGN
ncbi:thermonuclease family protein [Mesorhizobium mediterraneum]|uniref:thermonuclease family protein n=1 Tax=Mesorhizobium mediterraneum TaxID=43617 RepID=UPI00177AD914